MRIMLPRELNGNQNVFNSLSYGYTLMSLETKTGIIFNRQKNKFRFNIAIDIRFNKVYIAISEYKKIFWELLDVKEYRFPEGITKDDSGFSEWLKDIFSNYKKKYPKSFVWFLISSQHVKCHFLTVPPVSEERLDNLVRLNLKKEHQLDLKQYIVDYHIVGETEGKKQKNLEVFAYAAKKEEVNKIKSIAKHAGISLFGITSYDLALSNLFVDKKDPVAHVFLGTDWSRIDIYNSGVLAFSRDIKTGFVSIAEEFQEKVSNTSEVMTIEGSLESASKTSIEDVKKFFSTLDGEKGEEILDNVLSSTVQRFLLQIRRTIDYYESNFGPNSVKELYFSGIISIPDVLLLRIKDSLDLTVKRLNPIKGRLIRSSYTKTLGDFEEMEFAPVIGCSMCPSSKFNFMYTSKDRKKKRLRKYISTGVSLFFVFLYLILTGYYLYLSYDLKKELEIHASYTKKLKELKPVVTEDLLKDLLKKVESENIKIKNTLKIYEPIAVLKDLSNMTPENIQWNKVSFADNKRILIDALIKSSTTSKMEMADYLLNLKYSVFVKEANIVRQDIRYIDKEPYDYIIVEIILN